MIVLGTGAMACLFGARLWRAGARVTLVGTWAAALERIPRVGIAVSGPDERWQAFPAARRLGEGVEPADLVLVLVKGHQTAAVAPWAASYRGPAARVLTLQNGLGNAQVLAAAAGAANVDVGVTTAGAALEGPAQVRVSGLGVTSLPATPPLAPVRSLLAGAGFPVEAVEDLSALVWRKLVASCAINALSALRGLPNGRLLESAPERQRLEAAAREAGAVAEALGIALGVDPVALALGVARATAANRSSMLQDLERGAPTEAAAINGALVREGRRLGVPTPVNAALWREVLARQDAARMGATR